MAAEFRPSRPDPEHRKCSRCRRVFTAGTVPVPTVDGLLICRDCRPPAPAALALELPDA